MEKLTKQQQKALKEIEKKVADVCDKKNDENIIDDQTGIAYLESQIKSNQGRDIVITISFDDSSLPIDEQLLIQGFELRKKEIDKIEQIRYDLLSLEKIGVLKEKESRKCFKRLYKMICNLILKRLINDDEIAIPLKK